MAKDKGFSDQQIDAELRLRGDNSNISEQINQNVIVQLAGDRQKYLCQGQSLNVYFPAGASKKYLHEVHFKAWKEECKGLYYLRTETSNRAENVAEKVELNKLTDLTDIQKEEDECIACQG